MRRLRRLGSAIGRLAPRCASPKLPADGIYILLDLKSKLIGSWQLVSYVATRAISSKGVGDGNGEDVIYPMTKDATGVIMYTPDAYMSAQLMAPGAKRFAGPDVLSGSTEEWANAGSRYLAYSGPFSVEEGADGGALVKHTMQVCSYPNWLGEVQTRRVLRLEEGNTLVLSTDGPIKVKGEERLAVLTWRKL